MEPTTTNNPWTGDLEPTLPLRPSKSSESPREEFAERLNHTLNRLERLQEILIDERDDAPGERLVAVPARFQLSIVIPVYNEHETIAKLLARVQAVPVPHEIIVVDDCSTDGTSEVLRRLETLPNVKVFYKAANEGKGAAVRTGFQHAIGDVVIIQDADLEYNPRDIPELLRPILEGKADVVYGSRFLKEENHSGSSWLHQLGNRLLTRISNMTTGYRLTDMETCYKAFRAEIIRDLPLRQNRFGFEPEITAKLARRGVAITELPVTYEARDWNRGKKIGLRDAFNALYCIVRYAWVD